MNIKPDKTGKPQLVETPDGFSVLYKNRFLYSRYAPRSAAQKLFNFADILPNTLIFCFSPVLGYGLSALLERIDASCLAVCIEADPYLYDFSLTQLDPAILNRLRYALCENSEDFSRFMISSVDKPDLSLYKRVVFFELSGGVQLYENIYGTIKSLAADFLANYWKNRVTLVKLGRLFSRNLFRNLSRLPSSFFLLPASVSKPLLVLGAGPSIDQILPLIVQLRAKLGKIPFFIIAVDSVLISLLKHDITPDLVVALESQIANEKAFMGAEGCVVHLVADLTSRPSIVRLFAGVSFLYSLYTDCKFLYRIREIIRPASVIPPLGSVGLAAIECGLLLRRDSSVPVFFAGLDFSFIPGKSHCRETPPLRALLDVHTRLKSIEDPAAAWREGSFVLRGKDGKPAVSNPALTGYGSLLGARYAGVLNVFDISSSGMDTLCCRFSATELFTHTEIFGDNFAEDTTVFCRQLTKEERIQLEERVRFFYREETAALEKLKTMLSTGSGSSADITALLAGREYLYVHFPDGHLGARTDLSFLKRVRNEIDFFLKDFRLGAAFFSETAGL